MYWGEGDKRELISGVFGPRTKVKGAVEARERVHFIGFVRERSFQPGELGTVIEFVANPHLFKDAAAVKAAIDTWPLQPAKVLNGGGEAGAAGLNVTASAEAHSASGDGAPAKIWSRYPASRYIKEASRGTVPLSSFDRADHLRVLREIVGPRSLEECIGTTAS